MNIWKGAILGGFSKHRDNQHGSFEEHLKEHGAILGYRTKDDVEEDYIELVTDDIRDSMSERALDELRTQTRKLLEYWFARNPIDGLEFVNPRLYYALAVVLDEREYDYYIPDPGDGLPPSEKLVRDVLNEYIHNQGVGREYVEDYLADEGL